MVAARLSGTVGSWGLAVLLVVSVACAEQEQTGAGDASPSPLQTSEPPVILPTPTSAGPEEYPEGSALRLFRSDDRFSTLLGIVEQGGIGAALPIWRRPSHAATILAPTNEAFERMPPEVLRALLDDRTVERMIKNHVLPDPMRTEDLAEHEEVQTLGVAVGIDVSGDEVRVAGVPLAETDIEVGASVIHVVHELVLPCNDEYLREQVGPAYSDACSS